MRSRMNTTTALVASLSLMAPSPTWAQETAPETEPEVALICPDGSDLPCPEGVEPIPAPMDEALDEAMEEAMEAETAEETADEAPAGDAAAADAPEAEAVEAETATETAEEAVTEEPAAETETAAEEAVEGEAAEEEVLPTESASDAPAETTEEAPAEMAEEETVVDDAAEQTAEEPAAAENTDDVAAETEASPESGEAVSDADPAAETEAEAEAKVAAETEAEAEAEADIAAEEVPELPVQPDAASGEAPVAAAASAPEEAAVEAEVTEEVVTEETARSSDEDFANKVNEAAPKKKKKKKSAAKDDDDGLSDGEKAVLLGLGAVAVGALLSNNRKVELNSGDRVVVTRDDGSYQIIKDDNALLRQPGSTVRTETFSDGSTRTTVTRQDGSQIVTIRDAEYRVLRRAHIAPDGTETLLIDDTATVEPVNISLLPPPAAQPVFSADADEAELRAALAREAALDRRFSLAQVRDIAEVQGARPGDRPQRDHVRDGIGRDPARSGAIAGPARPADPVLYRRGSARGLPDRGPYRRRGFGRLQPCPVRPARRIGRPCPDRIFRRPAGKHGGAGLWRAVPEDRHGRGRAAEPPGQCAADHGSSSPGGRQLNRSMRKHRVVREHPARPILCRVPSKGEPDGPCL